MKHKVYKKLKVLSTVLITVLTLTAFCLSAYIGIVWFEIPGVTTWRNIWIETAMTTFTHQWLATSVFPQWLIDDVMTQADVPNDVEVIIPVEDPIVNEEPSPTPSDPLNQKNLVTGGKDGHGNEILDNNIEEGMLLIKITGKTSIGNYTARLLLIDDPSRVFVGTTNKRGKYGQVICDMMENYNAVAGVNASGFEDPDGHGKGGIINGLCYSEGEAWGKLNPNYASIMITEDNKLVVGNTNTWDGLSVRDGAQFTPTVISNGQIVVGNSYSHQPRTIVAQREDGVFMFLVVDGRSLTSVGATYKQCAQILLEYGAVNAGACDGGSSSVLAYEGKVINVPSTPMKDTGRYLPNAFLVRSKKG